MTTERKIRANRANAGVSTGPKLATAVLAHRKCAPARIKPSRRVLPGAAQTGASPRRSNCGPSANAHIQVLARRIAEAQVDLRRIRDVRHQILSHRLNDPHSNSRANAHGRVSVLFGFLLPDTPDIPKATVTNFVNTGPQGALNLARVLSQETERLSSLARYERRALSRRKFAILGA